MLLTWAIEVGKLIILMLPDRLGKCFLYSDIVTVTHLTDCAAVNGMVRDIAARTINSILCHYGRLPPTLHRACDGFTIFHTVAIGGEG